MEKKVGRGGDKFDKLGGVSEIVGNFEKKERVHKMDEISKIVEMVKKEEISKSEGIRRLNRLEVTRWNISKIFDIKYQFVRNVLEREIDVNNRKSVKKG